MKQVRNTNAPIFSPGATWLPAPPPSAVGAQTDCQWPGDRRSGCLLCTALGGANSVFDNLCNDSGGRARCRWPRHDGGGRTEPEDDALHCWGLNNSGYVLILELKMFGVRKWLQPYLTSISLVIDQAMFILDDMAKGIQVFRGLPSYHEHDTCLTCFVSIWRGWNKSSATMRLRRRTHLLCCRGGGLLRSGTVPLPCCQNE